MHLVRRNAILNDLSSFREELSKHSSERWQDLLQLNVLRPCVDILIDLILINLAVAIAVNSSVLLAPLALILIANRQRALGNILHDASHRNLHRSRRVNDAMTTSIVAPLLFADLDAYREAHLRHHLQLGTTSDPDRFGRPDKSSWLGHYFNHLFSMTLWMGSVLGHLGSRTLSGKRKLFIVGWGAALMTLLTWSAGLQYSLAFILFWCTSRATVFHAITTFRELCDHYGLVQGGVISFTRDILSRSVWYQLVHPRNNGYHLTHHLLPAVPYYRLREAQRLFAAIPFYRDHCQVCDSYVFGRAPAVRRWPTEGNP